MKKAPCYSRLAVLDKNMQYITQWGENYKKICKCMTSRKEMEDSYTSTILIT